MNRLNELKIFKVLLAGGIDSLNIQNDLFSSYITFMKSNINWYKNPYKFNIILPNFLSIYLKRYNEVSKIVCALKYSNTIQFMCFILRFEDEKFFVTDLHRVSTIFRRANLTEIIIIEIVRNKLIVEL